MIATTHRFKECVVVMESVEGPTLDALLYESLTVLLNFPDEWR